MYISDAVDSDIGIWIIVVVICFGVLICIVSTMSLVCWKKYWRKLKVCSIDILIACCRVKPAQISDFICLSERKKQSCYRDLSKGLEMKTKTLTSGLKIVALGLD